jgi:ADP-ribose pyrophosphatase YjhB (NUDIX family)
MAYTNEKDIAAAEEKYGTPELRTATFSMPEAEFSMVKASQKHGRAHDVTIFILKDGDFIFTAKHWYPPGLSRAPSGAAKPGETLEQGAVREAREETGCKIRLKRYILRINCRFTSGDEHIDWTTHIFTADYMEGDLKPIDTREIRDVYMVSPKKIPDIRRIMKTVDSGGIHYRSWLTDEVMKLLFPDTYQNPTNDIEA